MARAGVQQAISSHSRQHQALIAVVLPHGLLQEPASPVWCGAIDGSLQPGIDLPATIRAQALLGQHSIPWVNARAVTAAASSTAC
jgi:hypothetical protein